MKNVLLKALNIIRLSSEQRLIVMTGLIE